MNLKYVSVIIPTYNDWQRLQLCLEALLFQSYPQNMMEVIVVNNNPNDNPPSSLQIPDNYKIIIEKEPGSYAARNSGLRIAKGEIIGFTDSDCIPDRNWIKSALEHFENNKECTRIAGHINLFPKSYPASIAEKYDQMFSLDQKKYVTKWGIGVTANLFSFKYVFDKVGLFDDQLMSFGDLNWGSRANKLGFKIDYVENTIVNHPARNLKELIKKEKRLAGGREARNKLTKNVILIYLKFIRDIIPHISADRKLILEKGQKLNHSEKLLIMLLRIRLQYVRALETMQIRLGKQPNRE